MITFIRIFYILLGTIGILVLLFQLLVNFDDVNPGEIMIIALADLAFFYLAYKTYPDEAKMASRN